MRLTSPAAKTIVPGAIVLPHFFMIVSIDKILEYSPRRDKMTSLNLFHPCRVSVRSRVSKFLHLALQGGDPALGITLLVRRRARLRHTPEQ